MARVTCKACYFTENKTWFMNRVGQLECPDCTNITEFTVVKEDFTTAEDIQIREATVVEKSEQPPRELGDTVSLFLGKRMKGTDKCFGCGELDTVAEGDRVIVLVGADDSIQLCRECYSVLLVQALRNTSRAIEGVEDGPLLPLAKVVGQPEVAVKE